MHHYVYSITYIDVPNIYYGSRSCKCLPEEDTKYWGTPVAFKEFMDAHASTRIKTIICIGFNTREAATYYEADLIREQWEIDKPLSLNAHIPGEKFCMLDRKHKPETRKKMSDSRKAKNNSFYGQKHSPEAIRKNSEAHKGKPAWNKGIPNSLEARKKMSVAHKGRIPEHRVKSYVGIPPTGDPVFFSNATKFCRENPECGFDQRSISACAVGTLKTYKGWRFLLREAYDALNGEIPPLVNTQVKNFIGISPEGEIYSFTNAKKFVEDNPGFNLVAGNISRCALGNAKTHRNWRFFYREDYENLNGDIPCVKYESLKDYVGVSPDGEIYFFTNASQFCRDNPNFNLHFGGISKCASGGLETHKGWRFFLKDDYDTMNGVLPPLKKQSPVISANHPVYGQLYFSNVQQFIKDNPKYKWRPSGVSQCLNGKLIHYKGWKFAYADESDIG